MHLKSLYIWYAQESYSLLPKENREDGHRKAQISDHSMPVKSVQSEAACGFLKCKDLLEAHRFLKCLADAEVELAAAFAFSLIEFEPVVKADRD